MWPERAPQISRDAAKSGGRLTWRIRLTQSVQQGLRNKLGNAKIRVTGTLQSGLQQGTMAEAPHKSNGRKIARFPARQLPAAAGASIWLWSGFTNVTNPTPPPIYRFGPVKFEPIALSLRRASTSSA
jgi:hypothetical protein